VRARRCLLFLQRTQRELINASGSVPREPEAAGVHPERSILADIKASASLSVAITSMDKVPYHQPHTSCGMRKEKEKEKERAALLHYRHSHRSAASPTTTRRRPLTGMVYLPVRMHDLSQPIRSWQSGALVALRTHFHLGNWIQE